MNLRICCEQCNLAPGVYPQQAAPLGGMTYSPVTYSPSSTSTTAAPADGMAKAERILRTTIKSNGLTDFFDESKIAKILNRSKHQLDRTC